MVADQIERRLERIETKLDEQGRSLVMLARIEERMVTLFNWRNSYDERASSLEGRLRKIEDTVAGRSPFFALGGQTVSAVLGAMAVVAVQYLFRGPG